MRYRDCLLLIWVGAKLTRRRLREMCRMYSPGFLFLSETKNDKSFLHDVQDELGFENLQTVEPVGTSGGLALLYSNDFPVKFLLLDDRLIDIETIINGNRVFMTFIYGDPVVSNREYVWERLMRIGVVRSEPWFIIGDFNEIIGNHEKKGGKKRSETSFLPFRAMIDSCGLIDFPFQGNQFSWIGHRTNGTIRCRLDRAMGNEEWHNLFSHTNVEYLKMWGSDHRPLLASLLSKPKKMRRKFMFDKRWIDKPGLSKAVLEGWGGEDGSVERSIYQKIQNCKRAISIWKKNNPSNSEKQIKELQAKIDEAYEDDQASTEDLLALKWQLCEAYREEEAYWQQKSRDDPSMAIRDVPILVTQSMNDSLTKDISEEEVKRALFSLNPGKTPGPDGMTALFFQKFWATIKDDLIKTIRNFFSSGFFDAKLNETNICLIPKGERPREMSGFRPISLCNVSYKVISKVLSLRLKSFLPELISETQSAFVAGRLITDNILIAQENFHALRSNQANRTKFMAIKTDMSKAYDRVEWTFLRALMEKMGFDQKWVGWIMHCISSVSYRILINGDPKGRVRPTRGIRQGDPISPYLFILCTEALIAQIRRAEEEGKIQGLRISNASPRVSHLLFADDSLFFCKADPQHSKEIIDIIRRYGDASGQEINFAKSSIMFGNDIPALLRQEIKTIVGISQEGAITSKLSSAIANFWWSNKAESRGMHWLSWEQMCTSFEDGGLGFRTLEEFNLALLAKQLWRVLRFPDSLLSRVLKGRYFRYCNLLEIEISNRPSYGWRSMLSAKHILKFGIRKTIRSGFDTYIWTDPWIPDNPPRPPKGLSQFRDPLVCVNTLIDFNTKRWKQDNLWELFPPDEITLIMGIKPSLKASRDGYAWTLTKSGNYSVKSGYNVARSISRPDCDPPVQGPSITTLKTQSWKLKTTRKLKHFVWQCLSGCLATCQRLHYRHIGRDKGCPRCGAEEESINHMVFECPPAKQVWALSAIPSHPLVFPSSSLFSNLDFLYGRGKDFGALESNLRVFPWIMGYIWKARNLQIFENVSESPLETLEKARQEEDVWRSVHCREAATVHTPSPLLNSLPQDLPICFIDGSWHVKEERSGHGWIVSFGGRTLWLGLKGSRRSLSPLHAELDTLIWAMGSLVSLGLTNIHFATDCLDLLAMTAHNEDWPAFSSELSNFKSLKDRFVSFSIFHILRGDNVCADKLAKCARARGFCFSHISSSVPLCLSLEESHSR
ncbi:uncharacterized protein LOC111832445 [Capsella rubella]|uniref:uncharacterized protein LOC111832445 n=1 Tax=Capsella rubella TaxID=81985 RepID=UPI000CD4F25A|nr:uncharacterized protein LOC111832445 [Capsella rubella]